VKVTKGTLYLEAIPANGIAMRAAGTERHIVSSRRHPPAEVTSDGTRRHDRDPHVATPQGKVSLRPKTSTLYGLGGDVRVGS
jgi:hypothetical protein